MNINKELADIGKLIDSTCVINSIRREISSIFKNKRAMVIGGKYAGKHSLESSNYDIVIVHRQGDEETQLATRRIKACLPNVEIKEIGGIVDKVIGIRTSRRSRKA